MRNVITFFNFVNSTSVAMSNLSHISFLNQIISSCSMLYLLMICFHYYRNSDRVIPRGCTSLRIRQSDHHPHHYWYSRSLWCTDRHCNTYSSVSGQVRLILSRKEQSSNSCNQIDFCIIKHTIM